MKDIIRICNLIIRFSEFTFNIKIHEKFVVFLSDLCSYFVFFYEACVMIMSNERYAMTISLVGERSLSLWQVVFNKDKVCVRNSLQIVTINFHQKLTLLYIYILDLKVRFYIMLGSKDLDFYVFKTLICIVDKS